MAKPRKWLAHINSCDTGGVSDVTPDQLKGVKALDIGLVIDQDLFATGEVLQINTVAAAIEVNVKTATRQHFMVHANANDCDIKQVGRALLKHASTPARQNASANAGLHVVLAVTLNHDGVDAGLLEQLSQ